MYLDSLLVPNEEIKAAGGVLKHWELARQLALKLHRWRLTFLSAPGQFLISTRLHTNLIVSVPPISLICRRRTLILVQTTASESRYRITILQGSDGTRVVAPHTSPFDLSCNKCHSGWYEPQSREGKIPAVDDSDDIIMVDP